MRHYWWLLICTCSLWTACSDNSQPPKGNPMGAPPATESTTPVASICACNGQTPAFQATLGGVPVAVCGTLHSQAKGRWQTSNYRLFDCTGTGTLMDDCRHCSALLEHFGDTLVITQFLHLPAGTDWEVVPVRQSVARFFPYQGSLSVKRAKSMLQLPTPNANAAAQFIEVLRKRKGKGEGTHGDWGTVIDRLLYLSLSNDATAQSLLRTFPAYFGFNPQGELEASYQAALATLRLHKE